MQRTHFLADIPVLEADEVATRHVEDRPPVREADAASDSPRSNRPAPPRNADLRPVTEPLELAAPARYFGGIGFQERSPGETIGRTPEDPWQAAAGDLEIHL